MELTRFIDELGDDVFALALITTKSFDAAKEIFVRVCGEYESFSDSADISDVIKMAYPLCREADSNDYAVTLTGVELDAKKQALLETVLQKPFIMRTIIHLHWENDLEPEQISQVTGESLKTVNSMLSELSENLTAALDKSYKDLCFKINAEDKLKAYVIRSLTSGKKRQFEVGKDAVPVHKWTKRQKTIIIIAAAIIAVAVCIVIPIIDSYYQMRREENFESFEDIHTDEIFRYTTEADEIPQ